MRAINYVALFLFCSSIYASEDDTNKASAAVDFLKTACASGEHVEIQGEASGGLSFIKKGVSGSFSFKSKDARGIVNGLRDELQHENLKSIRSCMEPHIDKILNALLGYSAVVGKASKILPCTASNGNVPSGRTKDFNIDVIKCASNASLLNCTYKIVKKPNSSKEVQFDSRHSSILDSQGNEAYAESAQIGRSIGEIASRRFSPGDTSLA
ncbi:MAG: hypothetical protein GXP08_03680, partial [Gammaproteobacteria bacterium]|nr:hypothetical protein [Gammaproteobacteria bacterium]